MRSITQLRPSGALAAAAALALLAAGCVPVPDAAAQRAPAQTSHAKAVTRADNFQAAAANGKTVVAAASGGVMLTSVDGGRNWRRQQLARPTSIVAMTSCPDGSFAALDFYRKLWIGSADGQQWVARPVTTKSNLLALGCDPSSRLWVVGSHTTILSSADRGVSWRSTTLGADAILTTVQFIDARNGVITGEFGTVVTTADGGASWQKQPAIPNDFYPYAALFTDTEHGWVSGLAGVMLHTADGGKNWNQLANQAAAPMYALVRLGTRLYGLGGEGQMVVLRGAQWLPYAPGKQATPYLAAGAAVDADSILVAGPAGLLQVVRATGQAGDVSKQ